MSSGNNFWGFDYDGVKVKISGVTLHSGNGYNFQITDSNDVQRVYTFGTGKVGAVIGGNRIHSVSFDYYTASGIIPLLSDGTVQPLEIGKTGCFYFSGNAIFSNNTQGQSVDGLGLQQCSTTAEIDGSGFHSGTCASGW